MLRSVDSAPLSLAPARIRRAPFHRTSPLRGRQEDPGTRSITGFWRGFAPSDCLYCRFALLDSTLLEKRSLPDIRPPSTSRSTLHFSRASAAASSSCRTKQSVHGTGLRQRQMRRARSARRASVDHGMPSSDVKRSSAATIQSRAMNNDVEVNGRRYRWPRLPCVVITVDGGDPRYFDDALKRGLMPALREMLRRVSTRSSSTASWRSPSATRAPERSGSLAARLRSC